MSKNPYEVLGVGNNASVEEVRKAYKTLAKKYQSDEYATGPLSDVAKSKMKELDDAYDEIISSLGSSKASSNNEQAYSTYSSASSEYSDVRSLLNRNRLEEAETILNGVYENSRDAEWYFLKGQVHQRRGWFDEAHKCYSTACSMDPQNTEYASAFNSMNNGASGGYRTSRYNRNSGSGCDMCDVCSGLICADCCCECFGGDLISCC